MVARYWLQPCGSRMVSPVQPHRHAMERELSHHPISRARRVAVMAALALLAAQPATASTRPATAARGPDARGRAINADSAAVAAVVGRYHRALATGDSAAALGLLAPDVVVLESGGVETRAEYRAHHLAADIAFARAVPQTRSPLSVVARGDAAWVTSTSTARGSYRGRAINSTGAELMVLSREPGGWKIRAIHWSSRAQRAAP